MSIANTIATGSDVVVTEDRFSTASARFRAVLNGDGGSAVIGWGQDEDAARADLAATIAFNLGHSGRVIA